MSATSACPTSPGPSMGDAARLSAPVAMAYVPLGLAFGILVVKSGLAWYWAPVSALLIFAGSIEFLAVGLIVGTVPTSQVALTALVVNFRHIFYGLSFPLDRLRTPLQKIYGVWALTDETYAITAAGTGASLTGAQITVLQLVSHLWWAGSPLAGALVGSVIPDSVVGFGFALTAMFITLFVDSIRDRMVPAQLAAAGASVAVAALVGHWHREMFLVAGLLTALAIATFRYWIATPAARRTLQ